LGFYLGVTDDCDSSLVLGYESQDGTRFEIYEERSTVFWHFILRRYEVYTQDYNCLSYEHALMLFQKTIEAYEDNPAQT
jgi:hypothetical protein